MSERTEVETKAITDLRAEVASLHEALIALGKNVDNQAQTTTDQAHIITDQAQAITDLHDEFAALRERPSPRFSLLLPHNKPIPPGLPLLAPPPGLPRDPLKAPRT